jgi:hypothetical protein
MVGMEWIDLPYDRYQWRALVNTVLIFEFHKIWGSCWVAAHNWWLFKKGSAPWVMSDERKRQMRLDITTYGNSPFRFHRNVFCYTLVLWIIVRILFPCVYSTWWWPTSWSKHRMVRNVHCEKKKYRILWVKLEKDSKNAGSSGNISDFCVRNCGFEYRSELAFVTEVLLRSSTKFLGQHFKLGPYHVHQNPFKFSIRSYSKSRNLCY